MNKLFYLLVSILLFLTLILLISIFSGDNNYSKKASLIKENKIQEIENNTLKNTNDILEFEIENAQKSKEHVENFARERLNLIYPNEYKSVTFSSLDNMIYFMTKGYKADDITYYDTRLDRLTGELIRVMRPTEKFLKAQFENTGKAEIGYEQTKIYQCKLVEKLF